MLVDTTYRSKEVEIMDDLDMSGELLTDTLDKIAQINRWLGGNKLTLSGVKKLLSTVDKSEKISIVDLGCGNGDMLRALAKYAMNTGFILNLIGVDANRTTIEYAKKLSKDFPNIAYYQFDINSEEFDSLEYDIVLSTLFLHHFDSVTITNFIKQWSNKAKLGIVINDLRNEMVKTDGLISILRGFKKSELETFAKNIVHKSSIQWKWAFRYQWIIQK